MVLRSQIVATFLSSEWELAPSEVGKSATQFGVEPITLNRRALSE